MVLQTRFVNEICYLEQDTQINYNTKQISVAL